jgi:CelD/BcsL family acetyltransferase involved in cellulose biosynthesis
LGGLAAVKAARKSAAIGAVRATQYPASAWPLIAPVWARLAESSEQCSFFMTPAWVETWLEVFGPRMKVSIVVFEAAGEPVGACLLVTTSRRAVLIPLRRIVLNTSGENAADTTYLEFNTLLCRGGWEERVAAALAALLSETEFDEFALDGFSAGAAYEALKKAFAGLDLQEQWHPSYHVDLAALRDSGKTYEQTLSGRRRQRLRFYTRLYSPWGSLQVQAASDVDTALAMLDEMAELNIRRCAAYGRRSVFQSPHFVAFHQSLIRKCLSRTGVQILRLAAGSRTVGLVYSVLHRRRVYAYQCGFDYGDDKRMSPGMTTYAHIIQYCLERGFDDFDFLSGDVDYKRVLSTGSRELVWAEFRNTSLKIKLLDGAREARRLWKRVRPEIGGGPAARFVKSPQSAFSREICNLLRRSSDRHLIHESEPAVPAPVDCAGSLEAQILHHRAVIAGKRRHRGRGFPDGADL